MVARRLEDVLLCLNPVDVLVVGDQLLLDHLVTEKGYCRRVFFPYMYLYRFSFKKHPLTSKRKQHSRWQLLVSAYFLSHKANNSSWRGFSAFLIYHIKGSVSKK